MSDNINISPDMIENLMNMLKNSKSTCNSSNTSSSDSASSSSDTSFSDFNSSSSDNTGLDFETIMKMKSIIDAIGNTDDSDSKLLYSLKPYLRKSRQDKLDQLLHKHS